MVTAAGSATALPLLADYNPQGTGEAFSLQLMWNGDTVDRVEIGVRALVIALVLATVLGVDRALRGRVLILLLAGVGAALAIQAGLPFPFGASGVRPIGRTSQVVLFVLAPLLLAGVGLALLRRSGSGQAAPAGPAR